MPTQLLLEPTCLDNVLRVEPTLLQLSAYETYDISLDNCVGFTHTYKEEGVILCSGKIAVSIAEIVPLKLQPILQSIRC